MKMRRPKQAGVTLIEVLIAISLLSLLSVGILMALRVGLSALGKTNSRLIANRRVASAQRILEDQVAGFMGVVALCSPAPDLPRQPMPFFQGEPQSMRFVSTYSLEEAWRGRPHILEFQVIPGEDNRGVRLIVNEILYTGPLGAGLLCLGRVPDPVVATGVPRFRPIEPMPRSFVIADKLASCRFSYLEPVPPPVVERWTPQWLQSRWPLGIRIEMVPLEDNPARLRPFTINARVHVSRSPDIQYVDY